MSHALNLGLNNASGELIAYLDDDDVYFSHHLATLHNTLTTTDYKVAYSKYLRTTVNPKTNVIIHKEVRTNVDFDKNRLLHGNFLHPATMMHYKKCFEKTGMYDESIRLLMDWDFFVRLAQYFEFIHIDNITCEVGRQN